MYKQIALGSVLFIFYFASMCVVDSRARDSTRDYYQPVAITSSIDNIYINIRRTDDEVAIQDGIVKVPAGETLLVSIDAIARDGSKATTTTRSGVGASIEVVILDD